MVLTLATCRPPAPAPSREPQPAAPPGALQAPLGTAPTILSAHLARVDDPELGGRDGLLVVFDVELDAAAMQPRAFVVSRADAGPVFPTRAVLAPASEDDENRSVLLVGDFGDATAEHQPSHVAVLGPLYAEDGTSLQGLGASVVPFEAPPQVVAALALPPAPGHCEGAGQVLRTYWTDELRGVEPDDLARVRVRLDGGAVVSPVRFEDHATDHDEAGQDNVLDLCVDDPAPLRGLSIEAGAFRDVAGHASALVELRLDQFSGPSGRIVPQAGP